MPIAQQHAASQLLSDYEQSCSSPEGTSRFKRRLVGLVSESSFLEALLLDLERLFHDPSTLLLALRVNPTTIEYASSYLI